MGLPWRTAASGADVLIRYNKTIESTKAVIGKKCCRSLKLEFDLRIDTDICNSSKQRKFYIEALIDCGATDSFIDQDLVKHEEIPVIQLHRPMPVYQSDGEQNLAGEVTGYIEVTMRIHDPQRKHKVLCNKAREEGHIPRIHLAAETQPGNRLGKKASQTDSLSIRGLRAKEPHGNNTRTG